MGTISINGVTYSGEYNTINIVGGKVFLDGKLMMEDDSIAKAVEVRVLSGKIENLHSDKSITCDDVGGNVSAGGSVTCDDVNGNVSAGGSISCEDVYGRATAGVLIRS